MEIEKARTGNTCPERLDAMRKERDHYKELAEHWRLMWEKADEENRMLTGRLL